MTYKDMTTTVNKREDLTPEVLRTLLDYNPKTGEFTWKKRESNWGKTPRWVAHWNRKNAGKPTLTTATADDARYGFICRVQIQAHIAAYIYVMGKEPEALIFPLNGDYSDLRWENLCWNGRKDTDGAEFVATYKKASIAPFGKVK